ncbi:MAG: 2,3-bisphosphoglycerate-independent phosphoglycerate mutase [Nanobdellota archaeon]
MEKVILVIRDGWGYRKSCEDNAICQAKTPVAESLMEKYPNTLIEAAGESVGLPEGYQGNSEVGHLTIGSGRTIFQSLARINKSIEDGSFFDIEEFNKAIDNCRKHGTSLHLIGLLQDEGVHSHIDHLFAILDLCKKKDFSDIRVHVITDGRDAPVTASLDKIKKLRAKLEETGGEIATLSGRYYAMDRDKRWDRTKLAYDCIVKGEADTFEDITEKVKGCHGNDETDEFIRPRKHESYEGIKEKDSIIFYNFRTDRPRQLTKAIVEKDFEGWDRKPLDVFYLAMTQYYRPMDAHVAFKDVDIKNHIGQIVSEKGLSQLRISETEKYAHVTFFFNGQKEEPYENEERILVHSPKVATYDQEPEMKASEIADKLVPEIKKDKHDLIVTNLVNGDMVGHTGDPEAIRKGIEAVDSALGRIVEAGKEKGYTMLIFADHGNAEDQTPEWRTSHTKNKVPLIVVSDKDFRLSSGGLRDIAPSVLKLMGIEKPEEMTGEVILE